MVVAIRDLIDLKFYHKEINEKRGRVRELTEKQCQDILFDREPQYAPFVVFLRSEDQLAVSVAILLYLMLQDIATDPYLLPESKKEQITFIQKVIRRGRMDANMMSCGTHLWHFDLLFWALKKVHRDQAEIIKESINRSCELLNEGSYSAESETISDYNYHGHCVWGLLIICIGKLTGKNEHSWLSKWEHLANAMGLFRFKWDNIVNLKERVKRDSSSIPKEVYTLYLYDGLPSLLSSCAMEANKNVINHLVIDAFSHLPNCLHLLNRIKEPALFHLYAIPLACQLLSLCRIFNSQLKDVSINGWIKEMDLARLHARIHDFEDVAILIEEELENVIASMKDSDLLMGELLVCCWEVIHICRNCRQETLKRTLVPWELSIGTLVELILVAILGILLLSLIDL